MQQMSVVVVLLLRWEACQPVCALFQWMSVAGMLSNSLFLCGCGLCCLVQAAAAIDMDSDDADAPLMLQQPLQRKRSRPATVSADDTGAEDCMGVAQSASAAAALPLRNLMLIGDMLEPRQHRDRYAHVTPHYACTDVSWPWLLRGSVCVVVACNQCQGFLWCAVIVPYWVAVGRALGV